VTTSTRTYTTLRDSINCKVYMQTAIDAHSCHDWVRPNPSELPLSAVHLLDVSVIPFLDLSRICAAPRALLRKGCLRRDFPLPLRAQATRTISAVPRALKRFMRATRMRISAVWRSGCFDAMRSPQDLGSSG
jgi:hypothetical protein